MVTVSQRGYRVQWSQLANTKKVLKLTLMNKKGVLSHYAPSLSGEKYITLRATTLRFTIFVNSLHKTKVLFGV